MPMTHRTPRVRLERRTAPELDADLVIVPVSDGDDFADVPGLAQAAGGEALAARARGAFSAKPFETLVLPTQGAGWQAPRVALVGVGAAPSCSADTLRRLATAAGLTARGHRLGRIGIVMRPWTGVPHEDAAQALAEGALLANYDGASLKTADHAPRWLDDVAIAGVGAGPGVEAAIARGAILGEATNQARELANEP